MNTDTITPILLIFVRYAVSGVGVWMASKGFSEADTSAVVENATFLVTGALMALGPAIYAALQRPSPRGLEAAFAVDEFIPTDADVVIKTPGAQPDIIVPGKEKAK